MESLRSICFYKIYGSIAQKKVIHRGGFQFQLISDYWNIGVRTKDWCPFFSTLQYSITPLLQARDFQEFLAPFKLPYLLLINPKIYPPWQSRIFRNGWKALATGNMPPSIGIFFNQLSENRHPDTDEYITFAIFARSGFKKSLTDGCLLLVAKFFQPFLNILYDHGGYIHLSEFLQHFGITLLFAAPCSYKPLFQSGWSPYLVTAADNLMHFLLWAAHIDGGQTCQKRIG